MREAVLQEVVLRAADIGGQVNMVRSRFLGKLNMDSISIDQSLLMRESTDFQEVDLTGADIGAHVSMNGLMFRGLLKMNLISIGGDLFMHDVIFGEVSLIAATIAGHVAMNSSTFQGNLIMNSIGVSETQKMTRMPTRRFLLGLRNDWTGGLELFDAPALTEVGAHVVRLHQLTRFLRHHPVAPAFGFDLAVVECHRLDPPQPPQPGHDMPHRALAQPPALLPYQHSPELVLAP